MNAFERARSEAESLIDIDGVVAVGEGASPSGEPVVVVMVTSRSVMDLSVLPAEIDGFAVTVIEAGEISALEEADRVDGDSGSGHHWRPE